jgi:hypothetical protein
MKKLIFLIFILFESLFALESSVLPGEVYIGNDFEINQTCSPICRSVQGGYRTKVLDFNPFNGITKCDIFTTDGTVTNGLTADTKNSQCVNETNHDTPFGNGTFVSENKKYNSISSISYTEQMTITKFLTSLVTLDDDYVDIGQTANSGFLVLKQPANIGNGTTAQDNATINTLNKSNLGFFVSLFYGFQKIYSYVQFFLFIFVGAFFLFVFVSNLISAKMEERKMNNLLSTITVPLIMVVLCFVPIPKADSINTTPIQEIIKYFVDNSNSLADRVSTTGTDMYMKKVYGSVGAFSVQGEKKIYDRKLDLENAVTSYKRAYNDCKNRYNTIREDKRTFQIEDEEVIKELESLAGTGSKDFTFAACKRIENSLIFYERELDEKNLALNSIQRTFNNNELQSKLSTINTETNDRANNYGWLFAPLLSSISIVVENLSIISSNSLASEIREKNVNLKNDSVTTDDNYVKDTEDGSILGKLAYFILPGAGDVYTHSSQLLSKTGRVVSSLENIPVVGFLFSFAGKAMEVSKELAAFNLTVALYQNILKYLPLIVGLVAGLIAFASYLIDLFKYVYIAPFMVLYAVTTNKRGKIIEFLINGVGLFLKPILIVISIFISLFFYYLFQEVFAEMILKQFLLLKGLDTDTFGFVNGLSLSLFATLLHIITTILVTFLMWKITIEGSKMFLTMAGLNDTDSISNSLSQRVDKYSFQV